MKASKWLIALGAMVFAPCAAAAPTYSSVFVFGDSLVDSGNAFLGTGGLEANPADGYAGGRFSNGYNFADYLSLALTGQPTKPALAGGLNLAVGGATAAGPTGFTGQTFKSQTDLYGFYVPVPIPGDALVLVVFGGNDVRDTILQPDVPASPGMPATPTFSQAAIDFAAGLDALYAKGARNFAIVGAPDIGLLPISREVAALIGAPNRPQELSGRSEKISALFEDKADLLDAKPDTNVTFVDLFDVEHDLIANPTHFGLPAGLNTTDPCQIKGAGVPQIANCRNSLYFDKIHPTTQVHLAISRQILLDLGVTNSVPEPATWAVMVLGFGAIGAAMRRVRREPAAMAA